MASTDVLSREETEALAAKIFAMTPGAQAETQIESTVRTATSFARGDAYLSEDTRHTNVSLTLYTKTGQGAASATRYDDIGLELLVAEAKAAASEWRGTPRSPELLGPQVYKAAPKIYFENNLPLMTPEGRAGLYNAALDATEAASLIGAGDIELVRTSRGLLNTNGLFGYVASTYGEFSVTARTPNGMGSGWAWSGFEDWNRVTPPTVTATAVDLAERTANPVALEPGRYTVILEPSAVAALIGGINWDASAADNGGSVFSKEPRGTNKIGLKMMDERLNMISDPWDSEAPRTTVGDYGEPVDVAQWFQDGVLKNLEYSTGYARRKGRAPLLAPRNLRLYATSAPVSLEEMIASTKRGVWVNRLSNIVSMSRRTELLTGTTRDGTFLIENGKITKAIKNFRFNESPFFILNKLEAAGTPVRASQKVVAPRVKVRDFDFTSLTDAV